jgi:hypothetical protein
MGSLTRIRRVLLPPAEANAGVVLSVATDALTVSTRGGVKSLRRAPGDVTAYRPGDTVRISGDTVTGRRAGKGPVYPV